MISRVIEWFNEKGFRILIALALLIFSVSIYYKGTQYLAESRFAKKDAVKGSDGITLKIVYPSILKVVPPEKASQQLSVDIVGYVPNTNLQAIFDFSESTGLIFYDSDGNVTPSIITLNISKSINGGGIRIGPEPLTNDTLDFAKLRVNITVNRDGQRIFFTSRSYDLEMIDASGTKANYWFDPLLEDGIPISLALALVGWGLDYRKKQKDDISKERQSMLQTLREITKTDPVEAMQRLPIYESQKWEESLKKELVTLRNQFESREYLGELLYMAGEAIEQGDFTTSDKILVATKDYFSNIGITNLDRILGCMKESPIISDDKDEIVSLLITALSLWAKYDEYSRRVVVHVIHHICKKHYDNDDVMSSVIGEFEKNKEKSIKRLLRDLDIKLFAEKLSSPEKYEWKEALLAFSVSEHSNIARWLQLNENRIKANPFKLLTGNDLHSVSLQPENWEEIESPKSIVISSESNNDRELLLRFSEVFFRKNEKNDPGIFPVYLKLDFADMSLQIALKEVAEAIAFTWIKLVGINPGAFLNLLRSDQYAVAEFLSWKTGSVPALQLWLRQYGLKETFAGNMIFRRIRELPDKVLPEAITNEKIFEWITLKPPDLEQTYILIDLRPAANQKKHKQNVEQLIALSKSLSRTKTACKIFTAPVRNLSSHEPPIPIRWDDEDLEKILDTCVTRVSRAIPKLKFSGLFWPISYPKATTVVVEQANGSLSELLLLGSEVINNHVQNTPQAPHLDESDLASIY